MKSPIRAAQNKQRGRMRPAGRQFDMPAVKDCFSAKEFTLKQNLRNTRKFIMVSKILIIYKSAL